MLKISNRNTMALITLLMMSIIHGLGSSASGDSDGYKATCKDVIDGKYTSMCNTQVDVKTKTAEIWCGLETDCKSPVCVQPPMVGYRCKPVSDNNGQITWACKGGIGTFMDSRDDKSFTNVEFNDLSTRCSWRCGACRSGWE